MRASDVNGRAHFDLGTPWRGVLLGACDASRGGRDASALRRKVRVTHPRYAKSA
jgi:hypothetical protein